jgi:diguanylate cyclase (GGDEF)-like protein
MTTNVASQSLRPRVLVIDDSKLIRVAAEKILATDYDVMLVNDGDEGWQMIQDDEDIQVVFSDLTMPRMDGFSLLKLVRESKIERIAQLPLIIMTTDADDESRREMALQLGATDFISKPFNSIDLKARAKAHALSEQTTRELQDKNRELEQNASKDALTGLSNRSYLMERLWQDRSYAVRNQTCISIMRVDIDNFNQLFVQYGKEVSQEVVKAISGIIKKQLRQEDTAARIGLSTFIIVVPGTNAEQSQAMAAELQSAVAQGSVEHEGNSIPLSISVGIRVPSPDKTITVDSLLEQLENLLDASIDQADGRLVTQVDEFTPSSDQPEESATSAVPTLDQSLLYIREGQNEKVEPHMEHLINSVIPLLVISDDTLKERIKKALE